MATNFTEMFGLTPIETKEQNDFAEGVQVGMAAQQKVYSLLQEEWGHRGSKFVEGILEGLREVL